MMTEKHYMRAGMLALAVGVAVVGYRQSRARADGIPAMSPMTYAGTLEEAGAPVNGTRNIRLTLWDDAASTDSTHSRCTTIASGTAVTTGRFQVTLDNACTGVVHTTPDLWMEVEVNGSSLGRTKLSAVPFAIEAARAAGLTPAASHSLVPPGTVVAFAGDTPPTGWLLCDGAAVSQSMYPSLFAAIGSAHGNGGGTGMFNLPDLRGRFVRGVDQGAMRDPDRAGRTPANVGGNSGDAVGTVQGDEFRSHTHSYAQPSWPGFGGGSAETGYDHSPSTLASGAAGGRETRPVNIALNYIIKY